MMEENKGEHTSWKRKRSKGKLGKVKHGGKRSDGKCADKLGGDWDGSWGLAKVNGDKIEEKTRVQVGWRSVRGQENTGVSGCRGARLKGRHQPFYISRTRLLIIMQTHNEGMKKMAKLRKSLINICKNVWTWSERTLKPLWMLCHAERSSETIATAVVSSFIHTNESHGKLEVSGMNAKAAKRK